jgi:hypothetical protein
MGRKMQGARGKSRLSRFLLLATRALRVLLQQNCDWPIIVNLDPHVRTKDAGLHWDAFGFQQFDKAADARLGHIGRSGLGGAGAATCARVSLQGELTDDECASAHIQH